MYTNIEKPVQCMNMADIEGRPLVNGNGVHQNGYRVNGTTTACSEDGDRRSLSSFNSSSRRTSDGR